jgi:hypothetical protein
MKTVRLENNTVVEIIPNYALPVEKWYGAEFSALCMEAPDEVEQNWAYDPDTETWAEPKAPEPQPEPTELEQLRADVDYIAMETGVEL